METENLHLFKSFKSCFDFKENSFWLKFSSVKGNSAALIQFKLKTDFSDSKRSLFSPIFEKFIFFPDENFLTISYIIDEDDVIFPSSITSTLGI